MKALVNSAKTCDDDIDAMRQTLATLSQIGVPQTVTPKLKFDTVPGTTKLPALPSGKSYLVSPTNSQVNFGTEMNPKANSKVTLQFPPPVAKEIKIRSHSKKHPGSPGKCLKESSVQRSKDAKILNSNDCSRNRGQSNGLRYQMDRVIAGRKLVNMYSLSVVLPLLYIFVHVLELGIRLDLPTVLIGIKLLCKDTTV